MSLDAYNAQYPLAYYEIGTAYSFYHSKESCLTSTPATADQISKFKGALTKAKKEHTFEPQSGEWGKFQRVIGVVINKYKCEFANNATSTMISNSAPNAILEVLFEEDSGYSVHKFGIEAAPVFFDDKEYVPVHEKKSTATGPAPSSVTGPVPEKKVSGPVPEAVTGPVPDNE